MSEVLDKLEAIADPVARAKACHAFLANGRATVTKVTAMRDEAIRKARPGMTIDKLTAAVGCRRNIVVDALRVRS